MHTLNMLREMFGTAILLSQSYIKPRPMGEVAAYAAGEGKDKIKLKNALSVCIRRQLSRRASLWFWSTFV